MESWRMQQRLAKGLLISFALLLLLVWALTPNKAQISETLLGNIALSRESGFDASFGAFPELVKDQGGSRPVPPEIDAPLRQPEYRGMAWVNRQVRTAWTLQAGVFSGERQVGNFLSTRSDREQFTYFSLPDLPDPAQPEQPVTWRYVVTYGSFDSRSQAEEVAAVLSGTGLSGGLLLRNWSSYQALYAALPPPVPVSAVPAAPASADPAAGQAPLPPVYSIPADGGPMQLDSP